MKNNKKYIGMALALSAIFLPSLEAVSVTCKCINKTTGVTEGTVDFDVCVNKTCSQNQKDEDIQKAQPQACVQSKGGNTSSYKLVDPATDCK